MKRKLIILLAAFTVATAPPLLFQGCVSSNRLESGGPYAATATAPAMPELFAADSTFDLAYSALDATFRYEKANRLALWAISPNIKHNLDYMRIESQRIVADYALARHAYLAAPTAGTLGSLQTVLNKLLAANQAALAVIATKGTQ